MGTDLQIISYVFGLKAFVPGKDNSDPLKKLGLALAMSQETCKVYFSVLFLFMRPK